jgi:membrane protein
MASRRDTPSDRDAMPWPVIALTVAFGLLLEAGRPRREGATADRDPSTPATGAFNTQKSTDEPRAVQRGRARQRGRGREAASPQQIPWAGWKDILWRTYEEVSQDRLLAVAAGVVFFGLLAAFPAMAALVSAYGLFADANTIGDHLSLAAGILPQASFDLLREQVLRIASKNQGGLTLGVVTGFAVALWSANAGMKAIFDALNVIYDEEEKRSFVRLNLVSLAFTLGAMAVMLLALGAVVVFPLALAQFGIASVNPVLLSMIRWPVLLAVVLVGLALLYRYGPSRRNAEWRWVSVGSVFASLTWIAGSLAFSYYLANFADYNATYGSLGAVIGLMMWMWLSAIVILVGAELNAEMEHQTARDSTVGGDKPLGARGAAMADTVGEAKA